MCPCSALRSVHLMAFLCAFVSLDSVRVVDLFLVCAEKDDPTAK